MNSILAERITAAGRTRYGHFSDDGREYVIRRFDTPRPWVNVLCNADPGYGVIVSQTGSGYSWLTNAELNRITLWQQDMIQDNRGKYLYLQDLESREVWSVGYQPVCRKPDFYECRHGMGYSAISSETVGVRSTVTMFVPPGVPLEIWMLEVQNLSPKQRDISVTSYLEWCLGTAHDTHREFHRTFTETEYAPQSRAILARKRLWAIPNAKGQGWNRNWDGTAVHSCSEEISGFECDRERFIGMYGSLQSPAALHGAGLSGGCGKWGEPVASLQTEMSLAPGEKACVVFVVGVGADDAAALEMAERYAEPHRALDALEQTRKWWDEQLDGFEVSTPDPGLDALLNYWLRYQAMAGRIWGRSGYYQPGGAYGFRDQLQDSQVFLPTQPDLTRRQILLHASHQFVAGNVFHWWQPITESGAHSRFSDDLLWLPFLVLSYLRETGDFGILDARAPYADGPSESLRRHCERAIDLSLSRFSERGLPLIGEGDWNDGLSAAGWDGKGESVWVGHFLCYILPRWAGVCEQPGKTEQAERYRKAAADILEAVNRHAWDGEWYVRATCDDGTVIGSRECREGQMFLNAQTWAVIAGTCPAERQAELMHTTREKLYTQAGPVLLRPAYTNPDERIGYLTRYAPAARENGGVYVHAATWAIWAECLLGQGDQAWSIYQAISPCMRGLDADAYRAEPYVTPGNIDGPDSPNFGRGGWTWYTGSAAWLFRVMTEWVLGVRPEEGGLRISPCLPGHWDDFSMYRRFRGAGYRIEVRRGAGEQAGIVLDGHRIDGDVIPDLRDGADHSVEVVIGG